MSFADQSLCGVFWFFSLRYSLHPWSANDELVENIRALMSFIRGAHDSRMMSIRESFACAHERYETHET